VSIDLIVSDKGNELYTRLSRTIKKATTHPWFVAIKILYSELDDFSKKLEAPPVTCKRGCSHCCNVSVSITTPEAAYISKNAQLPMNNKDEKAKVDYKQVCPFLKNNECSIYEFRPAVCRVFVSYDDPQRCADDLPHNLLALMPPGSGEGSEYLNQLYFNSIATMDGNKQNDYLGRFTIKDIRQFFGETL
jgi:Fe-S-cluster containining protein